jgi:hypothetical protein
MSRESDFHQTIDRAGNACLDATCAARAAGRGPLPQPHRRLLTSAIRSLERAQQALFIARNDPWRDDSWSQSHPKPKQLSLM